MLKLTNYKTKLQPFPVIVGISPFDFTKESCLSVPILHNMWELVSITCCLLQDLITTESLQTAACLTHCSHTPHHTSLIGLLPPIYKVYFSFDILLELCEKKSIY